MSIFVYMYFVYFHLFTFVRSRWRRINLKSRYYNDLGRRLRRERGYCPNTLRHSSNSPSRLLISLRSEVLRTRLRAGVENAADLLLELDVQAQSARLCMGVVER